MSAPSTNRTSRPGVARRRAAPAPATLVVVAACLLQVVLAVHLRSFVTDDSWISVRYAQNLAAGEGFVWNPGGPRVEGASNPLLVGLEALVALVGLPVVGTVQVLGAAAAAGCVLITGRGGRAVVGRAAATAGAVLVGCCAPFALWAVGGLETPFVALVLTAAVLQLARPDGGRVRVTAVLLALLPWLRPEGLLTALAVVGAGEAAGLAGRATRGRAVRRCAWLVGVPVASQAVLEAGRQLVQGHLLPNSVLYKTGTGEPTAVLEKFLAQGAPVVVLAVVGTTLVRGRARLLAVPPLVHALGSIGTLDSANAYSRFFVPVWPALALLAGVAVTGLLRGRGGPRARAAAVALTTAAGAVLLLLPPGAVASVDGWAQRYTACKTAAREDMARWLATTPAGTTFAVSDAGLVPARAGRTAIDSFLLNDPLLQRTGPLPPGERARLVLARRPDVLVLVSRDPWTFTAGYPTDRRLYDLALRDGWTTGHVAVGGGMGCAYHLTALVR